MGDGEEDAYEAVWEYGVGGGEEGSGRGRCKGGMIKVKQR